MTLIGRFCCALLFALGAAAWASPAMAQGNAGGVSCANTVAAFEGFGQTNFNVCLGNGQFPLGPPNTIQDLTLGGGCPLGTPSSGPCDAGLLDLGNPLQNNPSGFGDVLCGDGGQDCVNGGFPPPAEPLPPLLGTPAPAAPRPTADPAVAGFDARAGGAAEKLGPAIGPKFQGTWDRAKTKKEKLAALDDRIKRTEKAIEEVSRFGGTPSAELHGALDDLRALRADVAGFSGSFAPSAPPPPSPPPTTLTDLILVPPPPAPSGPAVVQPQRVLPSPADRPTVERKELEELTQLFLARVGFLAEQSALARTPEEKARLQEERDELNKRLAQFTAAIRQFGESAERLTLAGPGGAVSQADADAVQRATGGPGAVAGQTSIPPRRY